VRAAGFDDVRAFPQGTRTAGDAAAAIGCEAAAGTPSSVFGIAPSELVARTGGRVERVSPGS
jgi:hypothetical protein